MSEEQKGSRYAELAMELMGSKMAAEMVQRTWDEASPEVKKELANAVVEIVTKRVKDHGFEWPIHGVLEAAATWLTVQLARRAGRLVTVIDPREAQR